MINSKLILLLKTFDPNNLRRFGEFITSPYFNKKKSLIVFYKYLRKHAPEFKEEKISKLRVFKKVYPNKDFDNRVLESTTYQLLKLAEKFLKIERLEKEQSTSNLILLEELMDRKLDIHYRSIYKKAVESINDNLDKDYNTYLFQYQLSNIAKRYFLTKNQRVYNSILEDTLTSLDQFYFFTKLKSTCEILDWKNVISIDAKLDFIEPVIVFLKQNHAKTSPIISIYLIAYRLLTEENADEDFVNLRRLLNKYQPIIPKKEKNYLYLFGINFCMLQMQKNNRVYYYVEQCLELYLEGIAQKFLYANGYLTPWTFKNVVKLGFNLKKYDWTADFIQQYYLHLEEDYQEDAFHYNMADLHYRKQHYNAALTHLREVEYSDIFYNLGAKAMLIKIYYETDEKEALLSMIASFTIYLKRNKKISNNTKLTYLNFTTSLYRLLKASTQKLPSVLEEIEQIELLANRRWLLSRRDNIASF